MTESTRVTRLLSSVRPWHVAVLAAVMVLPSLFAGLVADDHLLRANLQHDARVPELGTAWWDGFHFFPESASGVQGLSLGYAPWWAQLDAGARLWRPLASASHALDFAWWPTAPWLMHLENVGWYALVCVLVALLYRRWLDGAAAGLAMLFYAVDPTHGMAAAWLANRNGLMAAAFGFGALLVHTQSPRWSHRVGAAALLALGLSCGEAGLGPAGLLAAYALTMEPGSMVAKVRSLVPAGVVVLGWAAVEVLGHFGVKGSGLYVDPRVDPAGFATTLPVNAVLQLASELGGPGPDAWPVLPFGARVALVVVAALVVGVAALALWPLLRSDARLRFFAVSSVLAVIPYCATFPSSRLMVVPGFGLVGLAARGVVAWWAKEGPARKVRTVFAWLVVATHGVLAVPVMVFFEHTASGVDDVVQAVARGLPEDPQAEVFVANLPDQLFMLYVRPTMATAQRPLPKFVFPFAMGLHEVTVTRVDAHTVQVRDEGGFFGDGFTMLTRAKGKPMARGERVRLVQVEVEVVEVNDAGVPTLAVMHLEPSLDAPTTKLLQWNGDTLVPLALVDGETARLHPLPSPLLLPPKKP